MKHTLKEYLKIYDPDFIQLVIADHIVNIDSIISGSWFIIRAFENEKFYLRSFENNFLILSINEV